MQMILKELKDVHKKLIAYVEKIEKILKDYEKNEKASGQKKYAGSKPAKKVAVKKAKPKKKAEKTAIDTIVDIIRRSKSGIDRVALEKKAGFGGRKMTETLYRAKKKGLIKQTAQGIYLSY